MARDAEIPLTILSYEEPLIAPMGIVACRAEDDLPLPKREILWFPQRFMDGHLYWMAFSNFFFGMTTITSFESRLFLLLHQGMKKIG
jgi:hypothetical protein